MISLMTLKPPQLRARILCVLSGTLKQGDWVPKRCYLLSHAYKAETPVAHRPTLHIRSHSLRVNIVESLETRRVKILQGFGPGPARERKLRKLPQPYPSESTDVFINDRPINLKTET